MDAARCAVHPENPAVGSCSRCGGFCCALDSSQLFGKLFCATCAARPEVNYLEAIRLKYWGKRDSWRWFYGTAAASYLASAGYQIFVLRDLLGTALASAGVIICVFYFLGKAWARYAIVALQVGFITVGMLLERYEWAIIGASAFIVSLAPLNDTRNNLAFQRRVSERKMHKYWDLHANNAAARRGAVLGVASLLLPVLMPLALMFSIIGLRQVDPNATPPIGKKAHAIFGITLCIATTAAWGTFFVLRTY